MINNKTIALATLGDKAAARKCTEAGVVLPCPICGSDDVEMAMYRNKSAMHCNNCFYDTDTCNTHSEVLAAWNTRAPLLDMAREVLREEGDHDNR